MPSNAESGCLQHQQIICTVANGNNLAKVNAFICSNLLQKITLPLTSNNSTGDLTSQSAIVAYDNIVGVGMIYTELTSQPARKRLKAATEDSRLDSQPTKRAQKRRNTGRYIKSCSQIGE
ncbi:hypothetical protein SCUCBS95973_009145 [Sporothrix curviconia]|uniref:Uncharacterized protein n=1 Tax=Sporothrix curviconia TaxID=1260050 RepID=A0ABP0CSF8_9PEZI